MSICYFTSMGDTQCLHSSKGECDIVLITGTYVPQKHQQQSGSGVYVTFNELSVAPRAMLLVAAGETMGLGC